MLSEIKNIQQKPGDPFKRWFFYDKMDLAVWQEDNFEIVGFQLSYDRPMSEKALTWKLSKGFAHDWVDDGESDSKRRKSAPVLITDGIFESERVAFIFKKYAADIDREVAEFVYQKLINFSND